MTTRPSIPTIIKRTCDLFNVGRTRLLGRHRGEDAVYARRVMAAAMHVAGYSYPDMRRGCGTGAHSPFVDRVHWVMRHGDEALWIEVDMLTDGYRATRAEMEWESVNRVHGDGRAFAGVTGNQARIFLSNITQHLKDAEANAWKQKQASGPRKPTSPRTFTATGGSSRRSAATKPTPRSRRANRTSRSCVGASNSYRGHRTAATPTTGS